MPDPANWLRTQDPGARQFLLQTSVLAELPSSACRAVTGRADALSLLEELYRRNLFLAAAGEGAGPEPAYRYHALFAAFLGRRPGAGAGPVPIAQESHE